MGTLSNCTGIGKVPNVKICVEIPFIDGPEGACTTTVTHESEIINHKEWEKSRPTKLMLDASEWSKIRKYWIKACRLAKRDGEECNIAIDSIDKAINDLDKILEKIK